MLTVLPVPYTECCSEATIISKCLMSIRKGGPTEAMLAAQLLGEQKMKLGVSAQSHQLSSKILL